MLWKRHESFVNKFYALADKAGFDARPPMVLNAKDYGVPQNRKRVFILATRKDLNLNIAWPPEQTHGEEPDKVRHGPLLPWRTAREVFEDPLEPEDPNAVHMNHTDELREVFRKTPPDGGSRRDSGRLLPCHEGHSGHSDVYGRICRAKPGPTMTTACINPSKGRFVHPTEDHGITLREAARFQTFPDDFIFEGGLMAAGAQIGNAVPVRLGEVVIKAVTAALAKKVL